MNEDIKNEILAALQALREGAPAAWQALCEEATTRGIFLAFMGGSLLLVSLLFGWLTKRLMDDGNDCSIPTGVCCALVLTAAIVMMAAGGYQACAPALTLLGR